MLLSFRSAARFLAIFSGPKRQDPFTELCFQHTACSLERKDLRAVLFFAGKLSLRTGAAFAACPLTIPARAFFAGFSLSRAAVSCYHATRYDFHRHEANYHYDHQVDYLD